MSAFFNPRARFRRMNLNTVVLLEFGLGYSGDGVLDECGLDQGVGGVPPGPPSAAPVLEGGTIGVGEALGESGFGEPFRVGDRDVQATRAVGFRFGFSLGLVARFLGYILPPIISVVSILEYVV